MSNDEEPTVEIRQLNLRSRTTQPTSGHVGSSTTRQSTKPSALKIKAGSASRLLKEVSMYTREARGQAKHLEAMEANGEDIYKIKQERNAYNETLAIIPDSQRRLVVAIAALRDHLASGSADCADEPVVLSAQATIKQYEAEQASHFEPVPTQTKPTRQETAASGSAPSLIMIKTNAVRRLHRELCDSEQDAEQQGRVADRYQAEGKDVYDVNQQRRVQAESLRMIPECQRLLAQAITDLRSVAHKRDPAQGSESEYQLAEEALELASA
ncbi:uncharacterized protein L969DRAFT_104659 [Mixia osmundae IAM 14324]|uniref:Tubulin-specific chaperone A n=1 Tax=Mixia osmundae (strain CBS 9802 / IAM 14324 / JCM 22182 / KY 12970) TaxID=764103 RepID=G7DX42_MIXOS|nr:uncharacterized protein L969DRAFT_104659 [Mixia osmundae IAM 14324]KEI38053.1 hypothetical protein L969DRAFT_104659 [Mixia osmundae IAM 14324]GAA95139.1 hypothetical protein E5Q_01794 [Mixia osmundae IAM 14324]